MLSGRRDMGAVAVCDRWFVCGASRVGCPMRDARCGALLVVERAGRASFGSWASVGSGDVVDAEEGLERVEVVGMPAVGFQNDAPGSIVLSVDDACSLRRLPHV